MSGGIIGELNRVLGLKNEAMETLLIRERQLAERDAELARLRGVVEDLLAGCVALDPEQSVLPAQMQRARAALSSSPAGDEVVVKQADLEEIHGLAESYLMTMPTRNPQRSLEIGAAMARVRGAILGKE